MTVLLGCCTCFCALSVCTFALTAGIVLGYNYSVSEFQQTKTPNVTLRIHRGALENQILVARKKMNQALQEEEAAKNQGQSVPDGRAATTPLPYGQFTGQISSHARDLMAQSGSPSQPQSINEALAQRQYENYVKKYGYQHPASTPTSVSTEGSEFKQAPLRTTLHRGAVGWSALPEREKNIQPWREVMTNIQDAFNQKMLRTNADQSIEQERPELQNKTFQFPHSVWSPVPNQGAGMIGEEGTSPSEATTMHPWNEFIANQQYENFWHKFTSTAPPHEYETTENRVFSPVPNYQRSVNTQESPGKDIPKPDEPVFSVATESESLDKKYIVSTPTRVPGEANVHIATHTTLQHYVLIGSYGPDTIPVRTPAPELHTTDNEAFKTDLPERTRPAPAVWMRFSGGKDEAKLYNMDANDEDVRQPYLMRKPSTRFPGIKSKITLIPHLNRLTTKFYEDEYDEAKGDRMPLRKKRSIIKNVISAKYIPSSNSANMESAKLVTSNKGSFNISRVHMKSGLLLFEGGDTSKMNTTAN